MRSNKENDKFLKLQLVVAKVSYTLGDVASAKVALKNAAEVEDLPEWAEKFIGRARKAVETGKKYPSND